MSIDVETLADSGRFRLLTALRHGDVAAFVARYYWGTRTPLIYLHYVLSLAALALWGASCVGAGYGPDGWVATAGWGVLSMLMLLPVHELIHGAAYRAFGARDIRFGVSLRRLYAYALAHRFVVDRPRFAVVALAPFVVLSLLLVTVALASPPLRPFALGALLFHTGGTSGDWALLNYLWLHRGGEIYTYDDADTGTSYFYRRIAP